MEKSLFTKTPLEEIDFPRGGVKYMKRKLPLEQETELFGVGCDVSKGGGRSEYKAAPPRIKTSPVVKKPLTKNTPKQPVSIMSPIVRSEATSAKKLKKAKQPEKPLTQKCEVNKTGVMDGSKKAGKKAKEEMKKMTDNNLSEVLRLNSAYMEVGMSLLGCVTVVRRSGFSLDLPGGLEGQVSITSISDAYCEELKRVASQCDDDDDDDYDAQEICPLSAMFRPGMILPCHIVNFKMGKREIKKIHMDVNPRLVNDGLTTLDIMEGMVLSCSVKSCEDHGYMMELGVNKTTAFMPDKFAAQYITDNNNGAPLAVGQVLRCCVVSVSNQLVTLSCAPQEIEKAQCQSVGKLESRAVIPGMRLPCVVKKIVERGLIVSFGRHTGFIHSTQIPTYHVNCYKVGQKLCGTVLYTVPASKKIYLSLWPHLTRPCCSDLFHKFDTLSTENTPLDGTVLEVEKSCIYFNLKDGIRGVLPMTEMAKVIKTNNGKQTYFKKGQHHRCMVKNFKMVENVLVLRMSEAQQKMKRKLEDVVVDSAKKAKKEPNSNIKGGSSGESRLQRGGNLPSNKPKSDKADNSSKKNMNTMKGVDMKTMEGVLLKGGTSVEITGRKSGQGQTADSAVLVPEKKESKDVEENLPTSSGKKKKKTANTKMKEKNPNISQKSTEMKTCTLGLDTKQDASLKSKKKKLKDLTFDSKMDCETESAEQEEDILCPNVITHEADGKVLPDVQPKSGQVEKVSRKTNKGKDGGNGPEEDEALQTMALKEGSTKLDQSKKGKMDKGSECVKGKKKKMDDAQQEENDEMDVPSNKKKKISKVSTSDMKDVQNSKTLDGKKVGKKKVLSKSELSADKPKKKTKKLKGEPSLGEDKEKKDATVTEETDSGVDMNKITDSDDDDMDIAVHRADADAPRLAVSAEFNWSDDFSISKQDKDNSSEDEDIMDVVGKLKQTAHGRHSQRIEEEKKIYAYERQQLEGQQAPMSSDDFDRLTLQSPNSSLVWTRYMAFHLETVEIEKARAVAERALKTISFREEQEKLNIWVAYMNLENMYGTEDQLKAVFDRAVKENEPCKVYKQLAQIYVHSEKTEEAEKLYHTMARRFSQDKSVWTGFALFYFKSSRLESARKLLQRCLKSLDRQEHVDVISKFAQLEFKYGEAQRGGTMFENVLSNYPKRMDQWSVYLDMVIKAGNLAEARSLFERVIHMKISSKKMQFFFKKYMDFEKKFGDKKSMEKVKQKALEYVESFTGAS